MVCKKFFLEKGGIGNNIVSGSFDTFEPFFRGVIYLV